LRHYQRAIQIDSRCAEAYNNLGNVMAEQGRLDESVANYRKSLSVRPDQAVVHFNLGVALLRLGMTNDAAAHVAEALRLQPDLAGEEQRLREMGWLPPAK
jgi:tetratricopeptide (TPR) repeat protein